MIGQIKFSWQAGPDDSSSAAPSMWSAVRGGPLRARTRAPRRSRSVPRLTPVPVASPGATAEVAPLRARRRWRQRAYL